MNTNNNAPDSNEQDQTIKCRDCSADFTFSVGEQRFFAERQFTTPSRCKPCRDRRKAERDGGGGGGYQAQPVVVQAAPQVGNYYDDRTGGGGGGGGKGRRPNGGGGKRRGRDWDE